MILWADSKNNSQMKDLIKIKKEDILRIWPKNDQMGIRRFNGSVNNKWDKIIEVTNDKIFYLQTVIFWD